MLSASIITYFVLLMMGRLSPFCLGNSGGTEMLSDFPELHCIMELGFDSR